MNDCELVVLAAKAAGIEHLGYVAESWPNRAGLLYGDPNVRLFVWNPLNDDGEALRLAVTLDINISLGVGKACADTSESSISVVESYESDPFAATRRAIVGAAAIVGISMPGTKQS